MSNQEFQTLSQFLDPSVRGFNKHANPAGRSSLRNNTLDFSHFHTGIVVHSNANTFDAHVRIQGKKTPIPCIQLSLMTGYFASHGYTHSQLVQEGSSVLVYKPKSFKDFGLIVAVINPIYTGEDPKIKTSSFMADLEPSATQFTELAYRDILTDQEYLSVVNANGGRVPDLFPGESVWANEVGSCLALLAKSVRMQGSERSKIQCFYLDDLIRVVSGQWQHFSSIGEHHIWNDYGYVTEERYGSYHQCEVMGIPEYGSTVANESSPDYEKAKESDLTLKEPKMIPHKRFHSLFGHLGGLYQLFVTQPSGEDPSVYGDQEDKGIAHFAIDDNGRVILRSLSDIIFQRTNMIALPRKNFEAWDPEGDKVEDDDPFEAKKPFKWDTTKVEQHPLQLRDYFTWAKKNTYQRLYELSDLNDKKDWILKEEGEAPKPDNNYDTILKNEEDYSDWEERSTFFFMGKDGTMTMRNDKGAEITLCDGNIDITCPGELRLRSGKNVVVLAGDDLIAKARNSADITATEKDIRIKAKENIHTYTERSFLIDVGKDDEPKPKGKGENASLPEGVIIRAKKHKIFIWGDVLQLTAKTRLILEGVKQSASRLIVAIKDIILAAENQFILATGKNGEAGYFANGSNALVFGKSANVIASSSANVIKGSKAMVPLMWAPIGSSPYSQIQPKIGDLSSQFLSDDAWLAEFKKDLRKDWAFTYRTESDYDTTGNFKFYESFWQYLARNGGDGPSEAWKEEELRETYPWPGKQHYDGSSALQELKEEVNIDDVASGKPKKFEDREDTPSGFEEKSFNDYKG